MLSAESALCTLLALYTLVSHPSFYSLSVFCGALLALFYPSPTNPRQSHLWRRRASVHHDDDDQGCCISNVLVPLLFYSMSIHNAKWTIYAEMASLAWIPFAQTVAIVALLFHVIDTGANEQVLWTIFISNALYQSIQIFSSLHKVFTSGEWRIVTSLATVAVMEFNSATLPDHSYVALSGAIGCAIACAVATRIHHVWIRASILVLLPLLTVEGALWFKFHQEDEQNVTIYPQAATWLLQFLLETEKHPITNTFLPKWPRYLWLGYWAVILVLALVLSPTTSSVVVLRKWFHFIAILLFLPVTLAAPQLMSLSYAIALCVLAVVEHLRALLPETVQEFYLRYLDPQKDVQHTVLVSHMALILGCAMPLWIHECISTTTTTTTESSFLLPLFGILVLGVGDSLAALVGSTFGKRQWLGTSRTLEGSAAMCLGMATCCWCSGVSTPYCMPAIAFTTLLEASTTQIDNLVLPLAGAVVLLLSSGPS